MTTAAQIMTKKVLTVKPSTPMREIAALLAEHNISAVPVVDAKGAVVGMVSEGDLVRGHTVEHDERSAWWLEMIAEGGKLSPEYESYVRSADKTAADLMTKPVITAEPGAITVELAKLMDKHKIKRVPIVENGRLVGIVSRANLIHSLAMALR
jgi:CBS domain-containing protein